jgi:hypothetical protein
VKFVAANAGAIQSAAAKMDLFQTFIELLSFYMAM